MTAGLRLRSFLADRGLWMTPTRDGADIRQLIGLLRPVNCGIDLIRLGPDGDGGYLVPDDLDGISTCISPGVSTESGFELALAERGLDVHLVDRSVDKPPIDHARFRFHKYFVDAVDDADRGLITIDTLCESTPAWNDGADYLLQMDIEGAEYRVIHSLTDALLQRLRIIVIEFHFLDNMIGRHGFEPIRTAFYKVHKYHRVVHIHPNNRCGMITYRGVPIPRMMEFTFLRADRMRGTDAKLAFPHPLDRANWPDMPDLPLPALWYQHSQRTAEFR